MPARDFETRMRHATIHGVAYIVLPLIALAVVAWLDAVLIGLETPAAICGAGPASDDGERRLSIVYSRADGTTVEADMLVSTRDQARLDQGAEIIVHRPWARPGHADIRIVQRPPFYERHAQSVLPIVVHVAGGSVILIIVAVLRRREAARVHCPA